MALAWISTNNQHVPPWLGKNIKVTKYSPRQRPFPLPRPQLSLRVTPRHGLQSHLLSFLLSVHGILEAGSPSLMGLRGERDVERGPVESELLMQVQNVFVTFLDRPVEFAMLEVDCVSGISYVLSSSGVYYFNVVMPDCPTKSSVWGTRRRPH